jgi:oligopeptide/dipeptide ABC transporter ATP-binding protein
MRRLQTQGSRGIDMTLLDVNDLTIAYRVGKSQIKAVDGVSIEVDEGDVLGIVGESGCGKTTFGKSLLKLLPPNARVVSGEVNYRGNDLLKLSEKQLSKIRWKDIAYIPQSSMNALDPVYRISYQLTEAILQHEKIDKEEALERSIKYLELTGIESKRLMDYPHNLSGGMKQRVLIAMALVLNPGLIILDEPTTALDVISQAKIVDEILKMRDNFRTTLFFITHNIALVAEICEKVAVMYAGKIVEFADVKTIFKNPYHPYTMGLQNAYPSILETKELISIPGFPPDLENPPKGCRFHARCPFREAICYDTEPEPVKMSEGQWSLCHFTERAEEFRELAKRESTWRKAYESD